jgi:hypothetical protein
MGDESEFLQRKYKLRESKKFLPILFDYYKSCSIIFPNYTILHENKYIFKNIRKKQKLIDNQQEQIIKKIKSKKRENRNEEYTNIEFFNTKTLNSILNQTNTSNIKMIFGIKHNINKNEDNEESVNKLFKNIEKAEKSSFLASKKNIIKKNYLKKFLNIYKNNLSQSKIINITKNKSNKGRKSNINHNHSKYSSKNKNNENEESKHKLNSINNNRNRIINNNISKRIDNDFNKDNINSKINILYSNINSLNKNIIKKNNKQNHEKYNICIFETDSNIFYTKKEQSLNLGSSTNRKIVRIDNYNRKIIKEKEKN